MKKHILILFVVLLMGTNSFAQQHQEYLDSAEIYFNQEKYFEAYQRYRAAKVWGKKTPSIVAQGEEGMDKSIVGIKYRHCMDIFFE